MGRIAVVGIAGVILAGCVSTSVRPIDRLAVVDDVTAVSPYLSGYCIVAVDGKSTGRADKVTGTIFNITTYVPYTVVEPGEHTLTIGEKPLLRRNWRKDGGEPDESKLPIGEIKLTAKFEAGKTYLIKHQDGELSVVERVD